MPTLTRKQKIEQGLEKPEGSKKRRAAEARKEARKSVVTAKLRNQPGSPRKMRLVLDLIRGQKIEYALGVCKTLPHAATGPIEKLLRNAMSNWEAKRGEEGHEAEDIYIKTLYVDQSFALKRIQPAPQGRAHRIRKRYSTLFVELDVKTETEA